MQNMILDMRTYYLAAELFANKDKKESNKFRGSMRISELTSFTSREESRAGSAMQTDDCTELQQLNQRKLSG
jgi:hypothetical protein